jgi:hypothetical protein
VPRATHAVAPIVVGAVLIAIAVRSLKRFFRGSLSPDGVVLSLGAVRAHRGGAVAPGAPMAAAPRSGDAVLS